MRSIFIKFAKQIIKKIFSSGGKYFQFIPKNKLLLHSEKDQIFFGYYDVTPFNIKGDILLACRTSCANETPHNTHPVLELGYYDLKNSQPDFIKFSETLTWNWQQSCRLQWYGNDDNLVIYNTLINNHYGSVIQNLKTGLIIQSFDTLVYSVSSDGLYALTLNFNRLHQYRPGYGYNNLPEFKMDNDITFVHLKENKKTVIFTLKQAQEFQPHPDMKDATHYFNHLCFNPEGTHFMVTHLWITALGKRRTRIFAMDIDGRNIICPDNSGKTSHYCWENGGKMLIFHAESAKKGKYILYNLSHDNKEIIAENFLKEDGHPTLTHHMMLTDTYPSLTRLQHLILYDRIKNIKKTIAKLFIPSKFHGELRCDLHPRINHQKNQVCIDMVHKDRRAMLLLPLYKG